MDGEWKHDEQQPLVPDPLGNVNNYLYVEAASVTAQQPVMQMPTDMYVSAPQHSSAQYRTWIHSGALKWHQIETGGL